MTTVPAVTADDAVREAVAALAFPALGVHDVPGCRAAAAAPWLSATTATDLAAHPLPSVRTALAANPHTPTAVLAVLATDTEPTVRVTALAHPACPWPLVAASAEVSDLVHPDCPAGTVADAAGNPTLRGLALGDPDDLLALLTNPALAHSHAIHALGQLPLHASTAGLRAWIAHPHADPTWISARVDQALHDPGIPATVTTAAARNPTTAGATLDQLADLGGNHRTSVLANPSVHEATAVRVLTTAPAPAVAASGSPPDPQGRACSWHRRTIAVNPSTSDTTLALLTGDALDNEARYLFALQRATSPEHAHLILKLLPTWATDLAALLTIAADLAADLAS